MKRVMTLLAIVAITLGASVSARADVRVRGYYRSNGTYVQPHWRSNPDGNFRNNWSTYPNVNPYTGAIGTRRTPSYFGGPSYRTPSYNWSSPNLWNSRSPSLPSFSVPRYDAFRNSR